MKKLKSEIIICKGIKLNKDYVNVLDYSEEDMLSLCNSKKVAYADDYSFIRNTGTISTNFDYDTVLQCNYMAFQNKDYSNKWFFAFIDDVIYNGEANTEIRYTIDVWSTWFGDWTEESCFVIREHVNDDTIGLHTVPENIDVGEVIEESETYDTSYTREYGFWIGVLSNWKINDGSTGGALETEEQKGKAFSGISVYNNNIFGNQLFLFNIVNLSDFINLDYFIRRTNLDGHIADLQNIFIIPNAIITLGDLTSHTAYMVDNDKTFEFYTISTYTMTPETFDTEITKQHSFTGLTVKNNKCFVYPYNYLYVSNNQGSFNIFKYEDFNSNNCVFSNELSMTVGISGRLVPKNYKGKLRDEDESLALGKYPTCAWSSDAFTNWLTQNSVNIPTNFVLNMFGSGVSNVSSNANAKTTQESNFTNIGTGISIAGSILNTMNQFYQASLLPNIVGGQPTGDIIWSIDKNHFIFRKMRLKDEYMKIIDSYFSKFGYKVNTIKVPNITGRTYWNYVEIGSNEDIGYGDIPNNYMEIINNIARKGVTIWHNHSNIGNYNLNNYIK